MEILVVSNYKTVANVDLSLKPISWKLVEVEAKRLLRSKKFRQQAATAIIFGIALSTMPTYFAWAAGPHGINILGAKFWGYVKAFAKWGCLIMCGMEIVKGLNGGDTKSVAKIIFKYVLAYAAVAWLPWVFDEIDKTI